MKKIATLEKLEAAFQSDLGWRRKELSSLYLSVQSAITGSDSQARAIRSGIVLTYAHLEGFTRAAARNYFAFVRGRNLKYSQLANNFLALKISRIANQGTTKASYYHETVTLLTGRLDEVAQLPDPDIISANSNLNFAQFKEILFCISIDSTPFSLKENFFDKVLLERRNAIAHGEFRRPQPADYLEIHSEVLDILDKLQDLLIAAAVSKRYQRI